MTLAACRPRARYTRAMWCAYAFAAPYGVTGAIGVDSSCGQTPGLPKISALDACTTATRRPVRSDSSNADCSTPAAASPDTRPVATGSCQDRATDEMPARL